MGLENTPALTNRGRHHARQSVCVRHNADHSSFLPVAPESGKTSRRPFRFGPTADKRCSSSFLTTRTSNSGGHLQLLRGVSQIGSKSVEVRSRGRLLLFPDGQPGERCLYPAGDRPGATAEAHRTRAARVAATRFVLTSSETSNSSTLGSICRSNEPRVADASMRTLAEESSSAASNDGRAGSADPPATRRQITDQKRTAASGCFSPFIVSARWVAPPILNAMSRAAARGGPPFRLASKQLRFGEQAEVLAHMPNQLTAHLAHPGPGAALLRQIARLMRNGRRVIQLFDEPLGGKR